MTDARIRFTKASLDALEPPVKGSKFYYDDKTSGLAIRVTVGGAKTFYVYKKVHGRPQQLRIGPYPDLSVEQARKQAAELIAAIALGRDPAEERKRTRGEPTFADLFAFYAEVKQKKTTLKEDERQFRQNLRPLHHLKVSRITRDAIRELHATLGERNGIYAANRSLALMSGIFNVGIKFGRMTGPNPAEGVDRFQEQKRDRRLWPHELEQFLLAVVNEPNAEVRDYVLMSLYTGARKANVLAMRWEQIDFKGRMWRIPKTKNGTPQTIPLEDAEIELLRTRKAGGTSEWVFPGTGKRGHLAEPKHAWAKLLKRAGLNDLRLHDLRRTFGSFMGDTGSTMLTIQKALHHAHPSTTAIYARLALDPLRDAKRAAHGAMHVAAGSQAEIIPISEGQAMRSSARK